jgi:hypothetical protein
VFIYIYIYIYVCMYMYIYIYIYMRVVHCGAPLFDVFLIENGALA